LLYIPDVWVMQRLFDLSRKPDKRPEKIKQWFFDNNPFSPPPRCRWQLWQLVFRDSAGDTLQAGCHTTLETS
jgi:hypothetical protein